MRRQLAGTLVLAVVLSACTSGAASGGNTSTTSTTSTTVPLTTTVPPLRVGGTTEAGVLGSVERIPVTPIDPGKSTGTVPPPGTAAYRRVVTIGFRQFGSGKPLVLIPGLGATMSWWDPAVLDSLATHYRVTVFDLPGTGYSGPTSEPLSIGYLADVTAGLAAELGLSAPIILGWGLGGQVAVALAERHPKMGSSLVLVNSGLLTAGAIAPTRASAVLTDPESSTREIAGVLFPPSARVARSNWLATEKTQIPDVTTAPSLRAESHLDASSPRRPGTTRPVALGLPVLLIDGSSDAVVSSRETADLAAVLPGSQHYVWKRGGYACFAQDPARFLAVVSSFTG